MCLNITFSSVFTSLTNIVLVVVAEGMAGLFRLLITSHDLNHRGPSVDFRSFFFLLTPNSNVAGHVYLLDFHLLILVNEE